MDTWKINHVIRAFRELPPGEQSELWEKINEMPRHGGSSGRFTDGNVRAARTLASLYDGYAAGKEGRQEGLNTDETFQLFHHFRVSLIRLHDGRVYIFEEQPIPGSLEAEIAEAAL